jgi:hypothetical protein
MNKKEYNLLPEYGARLGRESLYVTNTIPLIRL